MTSAKIPIWKAGGITVIAYLLALVTLSASVKSDEFWSQMFATPRFRSGFIFYSFPFFISGFVLIAVGRWVPSRAPLVIARRVVVSLSILVLILAVCLMNVFGLGFDFKHEGGGVRPAQTFSQLQPAMLDRVPCNQCGRTTLPATAVATGGICMVCKRGIRSNLERANESYGKERSPNSESDYWSALLNRIYHTDAGYSGITHIERLYYLGCVVNGEVYNGGLHQFYSNSSGDRYSETLDALQHLGAIHSRRILVRSCELLFPGMDAPPTDRQERCRILPGWPDSPTDPPARWADELERLDKEYWADPDDLGKVLTQYGIAHGLFTSPPEDAQ